MSGRVGLVALAALALAGRAIAQEGNSTDDELLELSIFDFDDTSLDGWTDWPEADIRWTQDRGATSSAGTGPRADHTTGIPNGGWYMYVEASCGAFGCDAVCPRRSAILLSPALDSNTIGAASFYFHMLGEPQLSNSNPTPCNLTEDVMGSLRIDAVDTENRAVTEAPLITIEGNQGSNWTFSGVFRIPQADLSVRLRFEVETGPHWASDVAIDDVVFYQRNEFTNNIPLGGGIVETTRVVESDDSLLLWLIIAVVATAALCCLCCYYCPHPYHTVAEERREDSDKYDQDLMDMKVSARPNAQMRGAGYGEHGNNFQPERIMQRKDTNGSAPFVLRGAPGQSPTMGGLAHLVEVEHARRYSGDGGHRTRYSDSEGSYTATEESYTEGRRSSASSYSADEFGHPRHHGGDGQREARDHELQRGDTDEEAPRDQAAKAGAVAGAAAATGGFASRFFGRTAKASDTHEETKAASRDVMDSDAARLSTIDETARASVGGPHRDSALTDPEAGAADDRRTSALVPESWANEKSGKRDSVDSIGISHRPSVVQESTEKDVGQQRAERPPSFVNRYFGSFLGGAAPDSSSSDDDDEEATPVPEGPVMPPGPPGLQDDGSFNPPRREEGPLETNMSISDDEESHSNASGPGEEGTTRRDAEG